MTSERRALPLTETGPDANSSFSKGQERWLSLCQQFEGPETVHPHGVTILSLQMFSQVSLRADTYLASHSAATLPKVPAHT